MIDNLCCQYWIDLRQFVISYIVFRFRAKLSGSQTENPIIASLPQGIALEFERSDAARKLRFMLSELLFIMYQVFVNSRLFAV